MSDMQETPEDLESQVKSMKRAVSAVSFFLAGVTLGSVLARIVRKRDNRASSTQPQKP